MIKYFAKKYLLKKLNEALNNLRDNEKVEYWKNKITKIIMFLSNVMEYLKDNNISDEETDKILAECGELFK